MPGSNRVGCCHLSNPFAGRQPVLPRTASAPPAPSRQSACEPPTPARIANLEKIGQDGAGFRLAGHLT